MQQIVLIRKELLSSKVSMYFEIIVMAKIEIFSSFVKRNLWINACDFLLGRKKKADIF